MSYEGIKFDPPLRKPRVRVFPAKGRHWAGKPDTEFFLVVRDDPTSPNFRIATYYRHRDPSKPLRSYFVGRMKPILDVIGYFRNMGNTDIYILENPN